MFTIAGNTPAEIENTDDRRKQYVTLFDLQGKSLYLDHQKSSLVKKRIDRQGQKLVFC